MRPALAIDPPAWMAAPATKAVLDALTAQGATVRFVGGCVRNTLLEVPTGDIDLATDSEPDQVMALRNGDFDAV